MTIQVKIPSVGESINEVTIASWVKDNNSYVEMDEVLCEIESDKATVEITAETSGILKIITPAGETIPIGHIVGEIEPQSEAPKDKAEDKTKAANSEKSKKSVEGHPSPAARKILEEKGIPSEKVKGSGKEGRVTKEDAQKAQAPGKVLTIGTPPAVEEISSTERKVRREKMSSLRSTIAKRLVEAKNTTAMLTTFNEVDMSAVMELRKKYKDSFKEKYDVGLGFMSFFTKAASAALREFPAINAYLDGQEIIYHDYTDIGIAVSTPKGLVVPVVRNAKHLSLAQIEKEILRLALKARDNKISIDDMSGGTFTITNGGIFGSMLSTPILNLPQSGILGMHNIVERPVVVKGEIVIRPIMYVALSYDHRIVDGRESVGFLKMVKELIEDPNRLLLEV